MKKTLSILRDISPYLHSPFRHQLTMLAALSRFIRIPELLTALVDFLGPHELARLMQTCHYVKSFCEPAPYRHLDLTFHPRRTNLLLAPKAKGALMKNISSVHSLTLDRKELPYLFNALFVSYPPARTLSRGYSPLLQTLSVQMTILTRLQVCLRGRILDGNPDPFPLPCIPNDPRGRLRRLCRIIDASPSLKKLDVEGLPSSPV